MHYRRLKYMSRMAIAPAIIFCLWATCAMADADCTQTPQQINPALGQSCTKDGNKLYKINDNTFCFSPRYFQSDVQEEKKLVLELNLDTMQPVFDSFDFPWTMWSIREKVRNSGEYLDIRISGGKFGNTEKFVLSSISDDWKPVNIPENFKKFSGFNVYSFKNYDNVDLNRNDPATIYLVPNISKKLYIEYYYGGNHDPDIALFNVTTEVSKNINTVYDVSRTKFDHLSEINKNVVQFLTDHQVSGCPLTAQDIQ